MMKKVHTLFFIAVALVHIGFSGAASAQGDASARVAALKSRISAIADETTRVEDITHIQRVQRAFGYYVDKGYFGEAANLFADNGRVQYGVDGVYIGKARIKELLTRHGGGSTTAGPGLPFGRLNMHMQLQPMVTVAQDGLTAKGRWRDFSLLGNYKVEVQWGDAIMENDYVKEDGVWKISTMRYFLNFVAPYQGGWAALKPVTGNWTSEVGKAFPADAPSPIQYPPFPAVYVPPYHYANDMSAIQSPGPIVPVTRASDALGKLESRADMEANKLALLHSARAIENLQGMYGYFIDKGMWSQAASLFAADGSWEYGQSGVYIGRESVQRGLGLMGPPGLEQGQLNNYPMLQPIITVAEDNRTAKGRFRSDVELARGGKGQWGGGLYENDYVNDNGTWKIAKQHYWVTFLADYDKGWTGDGIIPVAPPSTSNPPDAPPSVVYESFPNTYIVPYHYVHPVTKQPHAGE